jgi:type II secretory pathway component GspD/PulD (secretin)
MRAVATDGGRRLVRGWTVLRRVSLGVGLAILAGWVAVSLAAPPSSALPIRVAQAKKDDKKEEKKEEKKPEKLISFSMSEKPWGSVFTWLTEQTGKPLITNYKPTGSFTFISPPKKKYTIPEIIDIINDGLIANSATQKYYLINRERSFTIVPADEKIDPSNLDSLKSPEELTSRGRTELVRVTFPLKTLVAEDVAPEVKKMMGPFGDVVAMNTANQLILQDTVANLLRIKKTLDDVEKDSTGKGGSLSYKCKWIKAAEAERILKELLGPDGKTVLARATPSPGGFPRGMGGAPPPQPVQLNKLRMHFVTSNERTNTVLVTGPADKVAEAEKILKAIDKEEKGQKPIVVGPPFLKIYNVSPGTAEATAKTLQEVYKASATCRISSAGTNKVLVYATPEDQISIAKDIGDSTEKSGIVTKALPVGDMDAATAAEMLQGMFGETKTGAPFVKALTDRNMIVVRGSDEQVADVKASLEAMSSAGLTSDSRMRVINLGETSASMFAEELADVLKKMLANPVQVIDPEKARKEKKPTLPPPKKLEGGETKRSAPPRSRTTPIVYRAYRSDDPDLVDPRDKKDKKELPGDKGKPITIFARGNRLIIASDDPKAMALIQKVISFYTSGKGGFQVIKLKNASAVEAAKVLDEMFNATKSATPTPAPPFGGGFLGRFGAPPPAPVANPEANRIRIVAYPATNSILVRASPLDMLAIRGFLADAIDVPGSDSRGLIRTWIVGPLKYASANEVASILKDVYREQTGTSPASTTVGGFPGFGGRFGAAIAASAAAQAQAGKSYQLSLGVDDRTNSLVLACPEPLYKDIKKLVTELDESSKQASQVVRVVSVKGLDPLLVQQAIDAIQGRTVRRPTTGPGGGILPGAGLPGVGLPGLNPLGGLPPSIGFQGFPGVGTGIRPGVGTTPGAGFTPGAGRPGGGPGTGGTGGGGRPRLPGGSSDLRSPGGGDRALALGERSPQGPDFFEQGVKDDPQPSQALYDPQQDKSPTVVPATPSRAHTQSEALVPAEAGTPPSIIKPVRYAAPPPRAAGPGDVVVAPRTPVQVEALPELSSIVVKGSPADVEAVLRIIAYLQRFQQIGDLDIRMVYLEKGDATAISVYLTEFYRRVVIGPSSTQRSAQPARSTQQIGLQIITQEQLSSVVLLPFPRFNSILVAAPRIRFKEVEDQIKSLDKPNLPQVNLREFGLKNVPAARLGQLITNFYLTRYPGDQINQVRITWSDTGNTLFVQAPPAEMEEIKDLIDRIDSMESPSINELRIKFIRNALADDLANLILRAITQGVQPTTVGGAGIVPQTGGGLPGFPGGGGAGIPGAGAIPGAAARPPGAAGIPGAGAIPGAGFPGAGLGGGGVNTKFQTLRFISAIKGRVESGFLEDIRMIADYRTNSIIISAPAKTMDLLLALVEELDVPPAARAEINIFPLKKADATQTANAIQQLFLGTSSLSGTTGGGVGGGIPGPGGLPGAAGGVPGLGGPGAFPGASGLLGGGTLRPLVLTLAGVTPEGAPLIDLRLSVDVRTNTLIVAGSRNDLEVVEAIITRLEDAEVLPRQNEVYKLVNATAVDVANALNTFITNSLTIYRNAGQLTPFQDIEREVVVVPEPVTNKLLISATPRYFPDVMRLIAELDAELQQVMIQVLIAEVDLNNTEEFGVEIGLQSPVLFRRSLWPDPALFAGGSTSISPATTGISLIPTGTTVNTVMNPVSELGFNFNNPSQGLPNNPSMFSAPTVVGYQALTNLGTGRVSPNTGIGGFVFSASSDVFNLLVRALKVQGRIDILSRPQIMTLDNQAAQVAVGQSVPTVQGSNITGTGIISTPVVYRDVGVILNVIPKINPDGKVTMRVTPQVSSVSSTSQNLGNGITAPVFNQQILDTTVIAHDGETVAVGGLITRSDTKSENKVPWFGDLPVIGAAFRYRQQLKKKVELLVILTPHIVRNRFEADRVLAMEGARMDWVLGDVVKTQGQAGMEPLFPGRRPQVPPGGVDGAMAAPLPPPPGPEMIPGPVLPPVPIPAPIPTPVPTRPDTLPPPRPVPPGTVIPSSDRPLQGLSTLGRSTLETAPPAVSTEAAAAAPAAENQGKESERWRMFKRLP